MTLAMLKPVELQRSSVNEMLEKTLKQTISHYARECKGEMARLNISERFFDRKLTRIKNRQQEIREEQQANENVAKSAPLQKITLYNNCAENDEKLKGKVLWTNLKDNKLALLIGTDLTLKNIQPEVSKNGKDRKTKNSLIVHNGKQPRLIRGHSAGNYCRTMFCPCQNCHQRIYSCDDDRPLTVAEMRAVNFVRRYSQQQPQPKLANLPSRVSFH